MKAKKLIGIIVLLAIIAVLGTYFLEGKLPFIPLSFDSGMDKLKEIDSAYGLNEERIVPEKEKIEAYVRDLGELKKELAKETQTSDVKALNLIIEIKLEIAFMKESLAEGIEEMNNYSSETACEREGGISNAIKAFTEAGNHALEANSKALEFQQEFPEKNPKLGEWTENVLLSTTETSERTKEIIEILEGYCA